MGRAFSGGLLLRRFSLDAEHFPKALPTNALNPCGIPWFAPKRTNTRRTSDPLQHKGPEVLLNMDGYTSKAPTAFEQEGTAVRIRPAAPAFKA